MLVFTDLVSSRNDVSAAIQDLRQGADTQHLPIIAFAPENAVKQQNAARAAGATLVVGESAVLTHLSQFLDQALQVE